MKIALIAVFGILSAGFPVMANPPRLFAPSAGCNAGAFAAPVYGGFAQQQFNVGYAPQFQASYGFQANVGHAPVFQQAFAPSYGFQQRAFFAPQVFAAPAVVFRQPRVVFAPRAVIAAPAFQINVRGGLFGKRNTQVNVFR